MEKQRLGVIDLGTNTFHLLIVELGESGFVEIFKDKCAVKIGEGGISKGYITQKALNRGIETLSYFASKLKEYQVSEYQAIATSAFRSAANQEEVIKAIKEQTGLTITIVDGNMEAELIYQGVRQAIKLQFLTNYLIIDIGGGSVEFIICNNQEVLWKRSYEIGGQRLMDNFHQIDPIPQDDISRLKNFLKETTTELNEAIHELRPEVLIGASGTFDTLVEIYHKSHNRPFVLDHETEYILPVNEFNKISKDIIKKNKSERLQINGLVPMRADMIVVATLLIEYLQENYHFNKILTSTHALKEGVIGQLKKSEV